MTPEQVDRALNLFERLVLVLECAMKPRGPSILISPMMLLLASANRGIKANIVTTKVSSH